MSSRGRVAIVVPCRNGARTLRATLESALDQDGVEVEIMVIDDGSSDETQAIARSFEPRVRVVAGPTQGVSAARNRGIAGTASGWIVFLDADDLLMPGTLRRRLDGAAIEDADVIVCDWQELIDDGERGSDGPIRSVDMAALAEDPEIACATHWKPAIDALMYRRSLIDRIGGFREDLPVIEDARLLFDAASHGARFSYSPHIGARVRVRRDSLSRSDPARFWRNCLLNGTQIEAVWRARGALSPRQRAALDDIYNGAAHGLFRAGDGAFTEALAALRAAQLPIGRRNRLAEILARSVGHGTALKMADLWTLSRRSVEHLWAPRGDAPTGQRTPS